MNVIKKIYCRTFQTCFKFVLPILPYREPKILKDYDGLINIIEDKGVYKLLIVTDKPIIKLGLINELKSQLDRAKIQYVIFDDVVPNPTIANVESAREVYLKNNCKAIIAFGGGSVMDCAKICGARVVKPKKSVQKMKGLLKVCKRLPLLIAIPTTAGTGSETTLAGVITDEKTHFKYPINDFSLIPHFAMLDYRVTIGLPKALTATTGMDALTHAVEAYIGRSTTKQTRVMSEKAVKLIYNNIQKAYDNGQDEEARKNMLEASYCAGVAFTKSYVGYVHAVAHSLGGQYGVPHGLANAIILPHFLDEYGKTCQRKLGRLAKTTKIADNSLSDAEASKLFINWIKEINAYMGIPNFIKEIKIEDIADLAKKADKEGNPLYPVPKLMNAHTLEKMYLKIMEQK